MCYREDMALAPVVVYTMNSNLLHIHKKLLKIYNGIGYLWRMISDLCKTLLFAHFLCQAQNLILKILNVFLPAP